MNLLRSIVRVTYAPFMMLGLTSCAYWIVSNGYAYLWLVPLLAFAYATAFAAERIAPFFEHWNDHGAHQDTSTNIWHTLVYEMSFVNGVLTIPVITWLFPFQGIWPVEWPLWAQLIAAFLIADFAFMALHYISHRLPLLWRLHAVHHGVGRLHGFNGVVRHPLHQSVDMIIGTAPLVVLGMPVPVAVLLGFLISISLIVQHSNVDARLGPLEGSLSIGRIHHLHHVNWGTEGDCNFGLFLTLWDRIFGTFNAIPSRPITAADMGIDEVPNFPKSYWEQLLFPFIYKPGAGEPERYRKMISPAQQAKQQTMQAAE
jgi:sterol desaturase/sphingolipid hydroxylase (fatty acid hydroxylase superfamily)